VLSVGTSLVGAEVKAARPGRTRLSRSARSFIEAYEPRALVVVNRGVEARESVGRRTSAGRLLTRSCRPLSDVLS